MFYLAFKFTFGNSLFCCCFFSAIFLLTVAAWLGVWGSLRLGEMVGYTLLCDLNCVVWHIITYAISTNLMGAFLKNQVHLCLQFLPGGLWGQEGRLTLWSEQSSSWGLQGAALILPEGGPQASVHEHSLTRWPLSTSCLPCLVLAAVYTKMKKIVSAFKEFKSDQEFPKPLNFL